MAGEVTLPEITTVGAAPAPAAPAPAVDTFRPNTGWAAIENPDGSIAMVHEGDLSAALAEGARPTTEAKYYSAKGGTLGQIASAGIGAARGASFGLSDAAAVGVARAFGGDESAEDIRRTLKIAQEAAPTASLVGEVGGGIVGAALIPGGAGATAVRAETMLGRAGARALAAMPRAALEGAAIGAGHQLSEDTLGNHAANGEKYVVSAFKGAAFGALLAGALSAGGGAALDKARKFYGATEAAGEGTVYRTAAKAAEGADDGAKGFMSRLGERAADEAEMQAFKSTGAKIRDFEKLGASAEAQEARARRIGRKLLDEEVVTPLATKSKIAQRLSEKTREVGEALSSMRGRLDKAAARPHMSSIVEAFETQVLKPLSEMPLGEAEAAPAAKFLGEMVAKGGESPTFAQLHKYRARLDDMLERGGEYSRSALTPSKAGAEGMRELRRIVEAEYEAAGERAAKELGGSFLAEYRTAKELYADLATAKKIAVKEASRAASNRAISLTDTIMGGAGIIADGPTGLLMSGANKFVRTFGNQVAATVLDRAAKHQGILRASASVDGAVKAGVAGFLGGAKRAPSAAASVDAATVRAVREAARDPDALAQRVGDRLGAMGLTASAPRTAQAAATTVMRAAAYLRDKAPKEPTPQGVTFGPRPARPTSATEMARFGEIYRAVTDPLSVVDDLQSGRVSREQVEALKAVYPELYHELRAEVVRQATDKAFKPTIQQEIALDVLFGTSVSAMMAPQNIAAFQAAFAQGADQQGAGQAGGQPTQETVRGLRRKGSLASGFDKQEAPT